MSKAKNVLWLATIIGCLIAVGFVFSDLQERNAALSANTGGIDETFSFAQAYGLDQTWTIAGVFILAFATIAFFLFVYPFLEKRFSVKAARA